LRPRSISASSLGVDPYAAVLEIRRLWEDFAREELNWDPIQIVMIDIDTARQLQSLYVAEIKKQMGVLLVIFGVISFSVVVLVFCIFYMMVKLKQRDVAILKSCGAANVSVVWLFLGFGVSVGVAGSGFGAVLGHVYNHAKHQYHRGVDSHCPGPEALEEQRVHVRQDPQRGGLAVLAADRGAGHRSGGPRGFDPGARGGPDEARGGPAVRMTPRAGLDA
jgi:hypothetical protein